MCSFLLIFLVVIVTFTSLQDFAQQGHLSPQSPQEASPSKAVLVSFSKRTDFLEEERFAEDQIDSPKAPQSGSSFHCADSERNGFDQRRQCRILPLEMPLWENKQKWAVQCAICYGPWTAGVRHRTQPKTYDWQDASWKDWESSSRSASRASSYHYVDAVHHQDIDPINKDPLAEADMLAKGRTRAKRD